jgi:hypothetical protein
MEYIKYIEHIIKKTHKKKHILKVKTESETKRKSESQTIKELRRQLASLENKNKCLEERIDEIDELEETPMKELINKMKIINKKKKTEKRVYRKLILTSTSKGKN